MVFQDTEVGEEVVVVIPPFTVTQLVQCEMPHACVVSYEIFFFFLKRIRIAMIYSVILDKHFGII